SYDRGVRSKRLFVHPVAGLVLAAALIHPVVPSALQAQEPVATLTVRVVDTTGLPLPGMTVVVEGCAGEDPVRRVSDERGEIQVDGVNGRAVCHVALAPLSGMRATPVDVRPAD